MLRIKMDKWDLVIELLVFQEKNEEVVNTQHPTHVGPVSQGLFDGYSNTHVEESLVMCNSVMSLNYKINVIVIHYSSWKMLVITKSNQRVYIPCYSLRYKALSSEYTVHSIALQHHQEQDGWQGAVSACVQTGSIYLAVCAQILPLKSMCVALRRLSLTSFSAGNSTLFSFWNQKRLQYYCTV